MLSLSTLITANEDGQTAVEYAAVMLLVAIVLVAALAFGFDGLLDDVPGAISNAL